MAKANDDKNFVFSPWPGADIEIPTTVIYDHPVVLVLVVLFVVFYYYLPPKSKTVSSSSNAQPSSPKSSSRNHAGTMDKPSRHEELTRRNIGASTDKKHPESGQPPSNKSNPDEALSGSPTDRKDADSATHTPETAQKTSTKKEIQQQPKATGSIPKVVVNVTGFCKEQGSRRIVLSAIVLILVVYLIQIRYSPSSDKQGEKPQLDHLISLMEEIVQTQPPFTSEPILQQDGKGQSSSARQTPSQDGTLQTLLDSITQTVTPSATPLQGKPTQTVTPPSPKQHGNDRRSSARTPQGARQHDSSTQSDHEAPIETPSQDKSKLKSPSRKQQGGNSQSSAGAFQSASAGAGSKPPQDGKSSSSKPTTGSDEKVLTFSPWPGAVIKIPSTVISKNPSVIILIVVLVVCYKYLPSKTSPQKSTAEGHVATNSGSSHQGSHLVRQKSTLKDGLKAVLDSVSNLLKTQGSRNIVLFTIVLILVARLIQIQFYS